MTVEEQLMTYVERAVRPLFASNRRKFRMREELLQHLKWLYVEETAAGKDNAAALSAAAERFGKPDDLLRELQQSVPKWERQFYWQPAFMLPVHEYGRRKWKELEGFSPLRLGWWMARLELTGWLIAIVVCLAFSWTAAGRMAAWFCLTMAVLCPTAAFTAVLLYEWMRRSLGVAGGGVRSISSVLLCSALIAGLMIGLGELFLILTARPLEFFLVEWTLNRSVVAMLAVIAPAAMIGGILLSDSKAGQRRKSWDRIEISE